MRTRREALKNAWDSDDDRGAVLYLVLLFLFIFVAVAAVSVDLAALGARGQDLQNTSDAAALAGIVEYQDQILANASPGQARDAAIAVVYDVMRQNGIDPLDDTILVNVEIIDEGAQFRVTIGDTDPNQFLPTAIFDSTRGGEEDIKSEDVDIARSATAEFLLCPGDCSIKVDIPAPFQSVSARGNGDGYKPIAVGTRLYALNHNSGNRRIVCVDRLTQAPCWGTAADPVVWRNAYLPGDYDDRNPEMPHTAVVGTRIYWSATDRDNGLRLFCWETLTDISCGSRTIDASLRRIDENDVISRPFYGEGNDIFSQLLSDKDENRGSGTVAVGEKVFVFTDDHKVHCYDPAIDGVCGGYPSPGVDTALAVFPDQNPWIGNHGSSIDRIVDEVTGFIYSTLHIPNAVNCSSPLPSPNGLRVVVVNEETGRYLASPEPDTVYSAEDGRGAEAWWDVEQVGPDEAVSFQSVNHGEYLDGDFFVGTSVNLGTDDEWNSFINGDDAYSITNVEFGGSLRDEVFSIERDNDDPVIDNESRWNYYPWQCGDPALLGAPTADHYKSGTWLHCFNTGTEQGLPGPCPTFDVSGIRLADGSGPAPLHLDGSRYSGRLWFYYSGGADPQKQGICSSGFSEPYTIATFDRTKIEINCVDLASGDFSPSMTSNMTDVRNVIVSYTGNDKDPDEDLGAWGDPHWNPQENRLFYPTEHNSPRIICYDFDSGPCETFDFTGTVPPNPSGLTDTEDYGFVSDGNCVFALGHNAFFWAFKASNSDQRCQTQPLPTKVERCPCAGTDKFSWGELDFSEIELDRFSEFGIKIVTTDNPNTKEPIWPAGVSEVYYIKGPGVPSDIGKILNLDAMQIDDALGSIYVEIYVEGVGDEELADIGALEIRFPQRPRLIE